MSSSAVVTVLIFVSKRFLKASMISSTKTCGAEAPAVSPRLLMPLKAVAPGIIATNFWITDTYPPGLLKDDPSGRPIGTAPPDNGTKFRVVEFAPLDATAEARLPPETLEMYETCSSTDRFFGPTLIRPSASIPPAANNAARLPPPDTERPTRTSCLEPEVGVRQSGACDTDGTVNTGVAKHPDNTRAPASNTVGRIRLCLFMAP